MRTCVVCTGTACMVGSLQDATSSLGHGAQMVGKLVGSMLGMHGTTQAALCVRLAAWC